MFLVENSRDKKEEFILGASTFLNDFSKVFAVQVNKTQGSSFQDNFFCFHLLLLQKFFLIASRKKNYCKRFSRFCFSTKNFFDRPTPD